MGKGRNKRHQKRRREQSRKACRERKKIKKAEAKRWKNQPNPPPRYKKRKKERSMPMYGYKSRDVQYINLGVSGKFLVDTKYSEYLVKLKEWYDEGVLSDVSFLVFGEWNTKTKVRLNEILKEYGQEWAINHLLFKNADETDTSFMIKRASCFKISHYVDMDKDNIGAFVMSNMYGRLKLFFWDEDPVKGWEDFKAWLKLHNPVHYNLFEQGEGAAYIIQTGLYAKTEPIEVVASEGYDADGWNSFLEAT